LLQQIVHIRNEEKQRNKKDGQKVKTRVVETTDYL